MGSGKRKKGVVLRITRKGKRKRSDRQERGGGAEIEEDATPAHSAAGEKIRYFAPKKKKKKRGRKKTLSADQGNGAYR